METYIRITLHNNTEQHQRETIQKQIIEHINKELAAQQAGFRVMMHGLNTFECVDAIERVKYMVEIELTTT